MKDIIITKTPWGEPEAFKSLPVLCTNKGLKYSTVKNLKLPAVHKGMEIRRIEIQKK